MSGRVPFADVSEVLPPLDALYRSGAVLGDITPVAERRRAWAVEARLRGGIVEVRASTVAGAIRGIAALVQPGGRCVHCGHEVQWRWRLAVVRPFACAWRVVDGRWTPGCR